MGNWFTKKGLDNFRTIADLIDVKRYLEVGVFKANSLTWVLDNIKPKIALGIDPYPPDRRRDEEEVERIYEAVLQKLSAYPNASLIRMESGHALRLLLGDWDFIYIDGSHLGHDVLEDAVLAWRVLREGGVLLFDDWTVNRSVNVLGLRLAIKTFVALHHFEAEVLFCNTQVGIRKVAGEWSPRPVFSPLLET